MRIKVVFEDNVFKPLEDVKSLVRPGGIYEVVTQAPTAEDLYGLIPSAGVEQVHEDYEATRGRYRK